MTHVPEYIHHQGHSKLRPLGMGPMHRRSSANVQTSLPSSRDLDFEETRTDLLNGISRHGL